jgi:hypothetical protein
MIRSLTHSSNKTDNDIMLLTLENLMAKIERIKNMQEGTDTDIKDILKIVNKK